VTVVALSSLAPMALPLGVRSLAFAESICKLHYLSYASSLSLMNLALQHCTVDLLSLAALCFMSEHSFDADILRNIKVLMPFQHPKNPSSCPYGGSRPHHARPSQGKYFFGA
jgi:hypothetical protein